jgi:hypothetical protein
MPAKLQHVNRRLNARERARHAKVRDAIVREIPPKRMPADARGGIAGQIRTEREARQLTWYALAKMAGIPNQATIRAIEQGKDVRLSNVERVARALGLTLELVR